MWFEFSIFPKCIALDDDQSINFVCSLSTNINMGYLLLIYKDQYCIICCFVENDMHQQKVTSNCSILSQRQFRGILALHE